MYIFRIQHPKVLHGIQVIKHGIECAGLSIPYQQQIYLLSLCLALQANQAQIPSPEVYKACAIVNPIKLPDSKRNVQKIRL